ncbi:MAG: F0F1 ATP synthase subunit gamma [Actinomycetia bacterium]|nr:F0F1 ATP synthase subunit gamma [Actinomycetes bacterium]
MAATLRELRARKGSIAATMKITKAMELIAASRVSRAQTRAKAMVHYNDELVEAVSAVAGHTDESHPLTTERDPATRAGILIVSADRGLSGAYNANVIRTAEGLVQHLEEAGKQVDLYVSGRKAQAYFAFRHRRVVASWGGYSERPRYADAKEIGTFLIDEFLRTGEAGGVDELHVVYTRFKSLVSQQPQIVRLLPLEVVRGGEGLHDTYEYEPDPATVLDALLPLYIVNRIHFALAESAASELAARQQAMHSATDNAKQLTADLTRDINQARQAAITQEINEIVGGVSALAGK